MITIKLSQLFSTFIISILVLFVPNDGAPMNKNPSLRPPSRHDRAHTEYKTAYGCEGKMLQLHCHKGQTIHLVRANYGRLSLSVCNEGGNTDLKVNCMSYRSYLVMQGRCRGKSSCNVTVSSDLLGDPCHGTPKYLEVQFYCEEGSLTTRRPSLSGEFGPHRHHSSSSHNHHIPSLPVSPDESESDTGVKIAYESSLNMDNNNKQASNRDFIHTNTKLEDNDKSMGTINGRKIDVDNEDDDVKDSTRLSHSSFDDKMSTGHKSVSSSSSPVYSSSFALNITSPGAPSSPSSPAFNSLNTDDKLDRTKPITSDSISDPNHHHNNNNNYYPAGDGGVNGGGSRMIVPAVDTLLTPIPPLHEPSIPIPNFGGDSNYDSQSPSSGLSSSEDGGSDGGLFVSPQDTLSASPASEESNSDNFYGYPSSSSAIIISALMISVLIIILIIWLWRLHRGQLFTSMIIKETVLHWNCPQDKVNPSTAPDHQYITSSNDTDNGNLYGSKKGTTGPILVNPIRDCTGLVENPLNDMDSGCNRTLPSSNQCISEYHTNQTSQLNRLNQADKSRSTVGLNSSTTSGYTGTNNNNNNSTTRADGSSSVNYLITNGGPLTRINVFSGHSRANISHYMDHIYESIENESHNRMAGSATHLYDTKFLYGIRRPNALDNRTNSTRNIVLQSAPMANITSAGAATLSRDPLYRVNNISTSVIGSNNLNSNSNSNSNSTTITSATIQREDQCSQNSSSYAPLLYDDKVAATLSNSNSATTTTSSATDNSMMISSGHTNNSTGNMMMLNESYPTHYSARNDLPEFSMVDSMLPSSSHFISNQQKHLNCVSSPPFNKRVADRGSTFSVSRTLSRDAQLQQQQQQQPQSTPSHGQRNGYDTSSSQSLTNSHHHHPSSNHHSTTNTAYNSNLTSSSFLSNNDHNNMDGTRSSSSNSELPDLVQYFGIES
ncbi:uncharacterized protein LOC141852230 isoform X2 [Brevipalpus obovatus]|uniref:uncharacterized protein LOC141852230 isoform X2 n=1 Tax=Brevipalpus obovatus TaxID=246614 RepID=UPI003D9EF4A4